MASGPISSWQIDAENAAMVSDFIFLGFKIKADSPSSHEIKTLAPWKNSYDKPRQHIKKQRHHFAGKGPFSQSYGFSSSHAQMWELDCKGWVLKNWCFQTVALEKILEIPLESKEIKPVNPKGNWRWIFIGRTDAKSEAPNTLGTWCEELTHWKRPWRWERLRASGEGDSRGWDGWMASLTQWTWVSANSERWWRTGKPGMLQFTGSQDLDKAYQLNDIYHLRNLVLFFSI